MENTENSQKMKIAAVVVLYNKKINDSETLNSINQIAAKYDFSSYDFIVYDNSIEKQEVPKTFPLNLRYYHDNLNGGLAAAYNYAYQNCIEKQIQWLLLLDQDTDLSEAYFFEIEDNLMDIFQNEEIVGVLPQIYCNQRKISPVIVKRGGFVKELAGNNEGICNFPVTGINSGTLLRVEFIKLIHGFNPVFKLDLLDYWYFHEIYQRHKKVYIMKTQMNHNLSIMNYKQVSLERYRSIIKSENMFFHDYCSKSEFFVFKIRLILRLIKQIIKVKDKGIAKITWSYLFFREKKTRENK